MDSYWEKMELAVAAAEEMPVEEFDGWLADLCSGDDALKADIESLLSAGKRAKGFLEKPMSAHAAALLQPEEGIAEGRRFGSYEILREIGHGGMGAVYLCRRADGEFDQLAALKIVRQSIAESHMVERFRVERQILASLNHPNIARLLDGGVSEANEPFLVMEFVEGEPITDFVRRTKMSVNDVLGLFLKVCSAVSYAHRKFIVHRDIKPGNILVTTDGEPKLLDFGLAKLLVGDVAIDLAQTQTAFRALTPAYASPEQLRGEQITAASDVYSLGIVLYELLCGDRPFDLEGKSLGEIIRTVTDEDPILPSLRPAAGSKLKGDLDNIVLTSLRREPERRYLSVEQLAWDIERYLNGLPVSARASTFQYRASKFIRRHSIGVAAATLVILSLLGGLGGTIWQARQARRAEKRAEQINKFLEQTLEYSNPIVSLSRHAGEEITVSEVLDEAAKRLENGEFDADPELKLELERTVASTYLGQAKHEPARKHMIQCLALLRQLYGEDDPRYIVSAIEWGILLFAKGNVVEAESTFRQYLPPLREEFVKGRVDADTLAEVLNNFAYIRRTEGDSQEAESLFRETLGIMPKLSAEGRVSAATTRSTLASTIADQGRFEEALSMAQLAVDEYRARGEIDSPNYGFSLVVLGGFLTDSGDLAAAESCLKTAESIFAGRLSSSSLWVGDNIRNQALLLYRQRRYDEAIVKAAAAATIYEEAFGRHYDHYPTVLIVKGLSLAQTGKTNEGEKLLRQAAEIRTAVLPKDHYWVAQANSALGECLFIEMRFAEAEPLLRSSYESLNATQGRSNPRTELALERLTALQEAEQMPQNAARLAAATE